MITTAGAGLMFRYVEEPVRVGRIAPRRGQFTALVGAGALAAAVLAWAGGLADSSSSVLPPENVTPPITTVAVAPSPTTTTVPPIVDPTAPSDPGTVTTPVTVAPPTSSPFPIAPANLLVVGDSTAWVSYGAVRDALTPLGWSTDEVHMVGCPPGGDVRMKNSANGGAVVVREIGEEPGCDLWWDDSLPSWLADRQPAVVVVIDAYGLAYEIDPEGDDRWCRLGDGSDRCEAWAADRLAALTARIAEYAPGAHVVWTTPGHIDPFGPLDIPADAIDVLIGLVRAESARSSMSVIELGAWLDDHLDLTVDGTHLGPDGVAALTPWMAVELPAALAGDRLAAPAP